MARMSCRARAHGEGWGCGWSEHAHGGLVLCFTSDVCYTLWFIFELYCPASPAGSASDLLVLLSGVR